MQDTKCLHIWIYQSLLPPCPCGLLDNQNWIHPSCCFTTPPFISSVSLHVCFLEQNLKLHMNRRTCFFKKKAVKTFPSLWNGFYRQAHSKLFAIWLGLDLHDFTIFGTRLAACPTPTLRKATSLLPEKRANRDPIDTPLISSVKLLRINHTQSTKHTCTSRAVPEEKGAREGRTGSVWFLCFLLQ